MPRPSRTISLNSPLKYSHYIAQFPYAEGPMRCCIHSRENRYEFGPPSTLEIEYDPGQIRRGLRKDSFDASNYAKDILASKSSEVSI